MCGASLCGNSFLCKCFLSYNLSDSCKLRTTLSGKLKPLAVHTNDLQCLCGKIYFEHLNMYGCRASLWDKLKTSHSTLLRKPINIT